MFEKLKRSVGGWFTSSIKGIPTDLLDEGLKELAEFLALHAPQRMDPKTITFLAKHQNIIQMLRGIRLFIPNKGNWYPVNELVSDFFKKLTHSIDEANRTLHRPEDLEPIIADEVQGLRSDVGVLGRIELARHSADEPTRDRFDEWFNSSPARRRKFVQLVTNNTEAEIRTLLGLDPAAWERLISQIPDLTPKTDFFRLRLEVARDAELTKMIQEFTERTLNAKGPKQTLEFWKGIERHPAINTIQNVRDLLTLTDAEILNRLNLKLRDKTLWQRHKDWRKRETEKHEGSRWLKWSTEFRKGPNAAQRRQP